MPNFGFFMESGVPAPQSFPDAVAVFFRNRHFPIGILLALTSIKFVSALAKRTNLKRKQAA